jgi:hypothetical protein
MLLAHFMPNSILYQGEWGFFQWCHPIPEKKDKEYVDNTQAQYIYQRFLYSRQLINNNSLHASALSSQNTNSRFSICKKLTQKRASMQELLAPSSSSSSSSGTVILHCDAIKFLSELLPLH